MKPHNQYIKFAWSVLGFNLFVILWGAYVRATGSGAGCGSHWPLCKGEVVPRAPSIETLIEFIHRGSSGMAFLLVFVLLVWTWRTYSKKNPIRLSAFLSMVFMITEALVGAGLVLFELVAQNDSVVRLLAISVHLVNTFLLLAFLSLTCWWASGGNVVRLRGAGGLAWLFGLGLVGMVILGMSGALTALGDTLFPVNSLSEGLQQDFSATAHFLIRLRLFHPTMAILVGAYLVFLAGILRLRKREVISKALSWMLTVFVIVQLLAGFVNVVLLAPVWMQLVHLFLADVIWITLVLLAASSLVYAEKRSAALESPSPTAIAEHGEVV